MKNTCKNCKHWKKELGIMKSYAVCLKTNDINNFDNNATIETYFPLTDEEDFPIEEKILTGENFGCIHLE